MNLLWSIVFAVDTWIWEWIGMFDLQTVLVSILFNLLPFFLSSYLRVVSPLESLQASLRRNVILSCYYCWVRLAVLILLVDRNLPFVATCVTAFLYFISITPFSPKDYLQYQFLWAFHSFWWHFSTHLTDQCEFVFFPRVWRWCLLVRSNPGPNSYSVNGAIVWIDSSFLTSCCYC